MPLPALSNQAAGALAIGPCFSVAAPGFTDARLQAAIRCFVSRLVRQSGFSMPAPKATGAMRATLRVECAAAEPGISQAARGLRVDASAGATGKSCAWSEDGGCAAVKVLFDAVRKRLE
jgi:hypothetical protein